MYKRVYFVSIGEYSEYSILGVFSTKEKAQNFIKTFPHTISSYDPEIEERLLDEFDEIIEACRDKKVFLVKMSLVDGTVKKVGARTGELWATQLVLEKKLSLVNGVIHAYVFADNKEHAVKIVAEQRTRMIVQM